MYSSRSSYYGTYRSTCTCTYRDIVVQSSWEIVSPKGAKVYPASRRRSNKRVGLKRQLAPHCVP